MRFTLLLLFIGLNLKAQSFAFDCPTGTATDTSATVTHTFEHEGEPFTVISTWEIIEVAVVDNSVLGVVIQSTPTARYKHGRRVSLTALYVPGATYRIIYTYDQQAEASEDNGFWTQYFLDITQ